MWKCIPNNPIYIINEFGEVKNTITGNILIGDKNSGGYHRVTIPVNNKQTHLFKHKLVALLFIPNPDNLPEVNHKDGNKNNNHYSNLEWSTRTHNEREAHRIRIKEYKPYDVIFENGECKHYEFAIDLANELGLTKRAIQNYLQGKSNGYKKYGILSINYST